MEISGFVEVRQNFVAPGDSFSGEEGFASGDYVLPAPWDCKQMASSV
jgi:hypothetical protein